MWGVFLSRPYPNIQIWKHSLLHVSVQNIQGLHFTQEFPFKLLTRFSLDSWHQIFRSVRTIFSFERSENAKCFLSRKWNFRQNMPKTKSGHISYYASCKTFLPKTMQKKLLADWPNSPRKGQLTLMAALLYSDKLNKMPFLICKCAVLATMSAGHEMKLSIMQTFREQVFLPASHVVPRSLKVTFLFLFLLNWPSARG